MYHQIWLLLCFLTSGRTLEMVVSTAQNVLFLNSENNDIITKTFDETILALNSDGNSNLFLLQYGGHNQLKFTNLSSTNFRQNSQFFSTIPSVDQVLPYNNGNFFTSNQSHVFQVGDEANQKLKAIYHGQRIQDFVFDVCNEKLIIIDSGKIIEAKFSPTKDITFENSNIEETKALAISTFNEQLVYISKNPKISHSDGFSLKSKNGELLCDSHPDKSYNIRKIRLFEKTIFLLDAHNLVIWKYDLNSEPSEFCNLEIWKRLDSSKQPYDLALLNSSQECISTVLETETSSKEKYSIDTKTKEPSEIQDQTIPKNETNPCLNFCHHGSCHLTNFGKPFCECDSNYSGSRCETEKCHNFCLNHGFCQISNIGSPNCTCPHGFLGQRCEILAAQSATCRNYCLNGGICQLDIEQNDVPTCFCPKGFSGLRCESGFFNYFVAFLCMTGVNVSLVISLIAISVIYCKRRSQSHQPQIIKKSSGRARVFSTSSNGSRSRSKSRKSNAAKSNLAFDTTDPIDDNYMGNKNHSCSALLGDDGQVLDLEDCCQMTICEKPCIEATFRKPAQRKKIKLEQEQLLTKDELFPTTKLDF